MSRWTGYNWWSEWTAPERVDRFVAVGLILLLTVESVLAAGIPDRFVTALFAVCFAAPVAVRRRWPAVGVLFATAICVVPDPLHGPAVQPPQRQRRDRAHALQLWRRRVAPAAA